MSSPEPRQSRLSLAQTTRLVARALGISAQDLTASFRPAVWADLPAILALRQRVIRSEITWDDPAYLAWRYRLGRTGVGGGDCWVLVHGGELLGMVGTQDLALHCQSQSCPALSLMDILIKPELENAGLGVWLNLAIQAQTMATLAIGANPHSIGMVRRLFDPLPNRRSFIYPVKLGHFLRKRLPVPVPGLHALVALGLEATLRLVRTLALRPWWPSTIQVKPVTRLDQAAMKALDARLAADPVVHVARPAEQLNWRLFDNPRGAGRVWGAWSQGQLVGLMALSLTLLESGRQAMTVLDLAVPLPSGRAALRALLWRMLEEARRQQVDYVSITSYRHDVELELRRCGFRQQPHPFEIVGWTCRDEGFKARVEGTGEWTLSEVHTDRV